MSDKEYTGGSVSYYKVQIKTPTSGGTAYMAECNDIIEALKMNYAEGNAFKAIWRSCAARNLGLSKAGYKDGKYDAEKVVFFGQRMIEQSSAEESQVNEIVGTEPVNQWIDWSGGILPVESTVKVEVMYRDGNTDTGMSNEFAWFHDGKDDDIIKFRVVK